MSIYVVENTQTDAIVLVEAGSAAQAARHILKAAYTVTLAKATDVAFHMSNGVKLERANADVEQAELRG